MGKLVKPLTNLEKLVCPHCGNSNIIVALDFNKKWSGSETNLGFCIKTATKNTFGIPVVKGCSKNFKIRILPRKHKLFPKL